MRKLDFNLIRKSHFCGKLISLRDLIAFFVSLDLKDEKLVDIKKYQVCFALSV